MRKEQPNYTEKSPTPLEFLKGVMKKLDADAPKHFLDKQEAWYDPKVKAAEIEALCKERWEAICDDFEKALDEASEVTGVKNLQATFNSVRASTVTPTPGTTSFPNQPRINTYFSQPKASLSTAPPTPLPSSPATSATVPPRDEDKNYSLWRGQKQKSLLDFLLETYPGQISTLKERNRVQALGLLCVHMTDGEHHQLDAAIRQIEEGNGTDEQLALIAAKLNASRSAIDQPCDQAYFYAIQRCVAYGKYKNLETKNDGRVKSAVKNGLLKAMNGGVTSLSYQKITTIAEMFDWLPHVVTTASTPTTIINSFAQVGMAPISFKTMAGRTPGWMNLTDKQRAKIYRRLPEMCLIGLLTGRVEEEDLVKRAGCPPDMYDNNRNDKNTFKSARAMNLNTHQMALRRRLNRMIQKKLVKKTKKKKKLTADEQKKSDEKDLAAEKRREDQILKKKHAAVRLEERKANAEEKKARQEEKKQQQEQKKEEQEEKKEATKKRKNEQAKATKKRKNEQEVAGVAKKAKLAYRTRMVSENKYCFCHTRGEECEDGEWVGCSGSKTTCPARNWVCKKWWGGEFSGRTEELDGSFKEATESEHYFCSGCVSNTDVAAI